MLLSVSVKPQKMHHNYICQNITCIHFLIQHNKMTLAVLKMEEKCIL